MSDPSALQRLLARTARRLPLLPALLLLALPSSVSAEVTREILTNAEPTNLVNITPIQVEREIEPGTRAIEQVSVYNDSDQQVRVRTAVVDLGVPEDPTLLAVPVRDGAQFGASEWVTVEISDTVLQPFEKITFDVIVDVPADAPVGSSYAGVEFDITGTIDGSNAAPSGESQVGLRIVSVLQLLLTVPGPVERDLRLLEAKTRDAFRLGGTSFVSYGVRYRNEGTVNDHVKGRVRITSLFGNEVETLELRELTIIRGAERTDRVVWADPPRFGIFSATVEVTGDDGRKIVRDLGHVFLLPPWWLVALIVAALVLPFVYLWWRRRREWLQYLEDEDWDEDEHLAY